MERIRVMKLIFTILVIFPNCATVSLVNQNTTEPVMVGKIHRLGSDASKDNPEAKQQQLMGYSKSLLFIFAVVAFSIRSNLGDDYSNIADSQYARAVENTHCTHSVNELSYGTYSISYLFVTGYKNYLSALSGGAVKCAR